MPDSTVQLLYTLLGRCYQMILQQWYHTNVTFNYWHTGCCHLSYITGYHFSNTACPGKFGFNSSLLKVLRYNFGIKTSSMTPIFLIVRIVISMTRVFSGVGFRAPQQIVNGKVGKYAKNCCPNANLRLNSCQHE